MPRDSLMSSLRVFCLVVTWTTASVTNLTLSIRDSRTDPSGSGSVNSTLHSHVPHVPCCWFFTLKKTNQKGCKNNQQPTKQMKKKAAMLHESSLEGMTPLKCTAPWS